MHVTFPLQLIAVPVEKPFSQSCSKCRGPEAGDARASGVRTILRAGFKLALVLVSICSALRGGIKTGSKMH